MGAEGYMWVTRYQKSLAKALDMARRETFAAGKFLGGGKKACVNCSSDGGGC